MVSIHNRDLGICCMIELRYFLMEHIFYTNRLSKSNESVYIRVYTSDKDHTIDLLDGVMMHRCS